MNSEHKANLRTALITQTWNKLLAEKVISSIEIDLKRPKLKDKPSKLHLAVTKEKAKNLTSSSALELHQDSED